MPKVLTEHFTLEELTRTTRKNLQEENRVLTELQVQKLTEVAELMEKVRHILGDLPIVVNSGYRCKTLNMAVGSSDRSQHLLCEAVDFTPRGADIVQSFRTLWRAVHAGELKIGQLIHETAERSYGDTHWIHISLGAPWREASRCNQILRMEFGKYTLLGAPPIS